MGSRSQRRRSGRWRQFFKLEHEVILEQEFRTHHPAKQLAREYRGAALSAKASLRPPSIQYDKWIQKREIQQRRRIDARVVNLHQSKTSELSKEPQAKKPRQKAVTKVDTVLLPHPNCIVFVGGHNSPKRFGFAKQVAKLTF